MFSIAWGLGPSFGGVFGIAQGVLGEITYRLSVAVT
jgi:hypothetical protein